VFGRNKKKIKNRMEWKTQVSGIAGGRDNFLFAPCTTTGIGFAMLSAGAFYEVTRPKCPCI